MARPCVMRAIRRNRDKLAAALENGAVLVEVGTTVAKAVKKRRAVKRAKRAANG